MMALTKRLSPACSERRGCGRTKIYGSLRSQHGARLRLRAERGPSPQELVKQASLAARLQDLDIIRLEAGIERREPAQWDELRVWYASGTQATGKPPHGGAYRCLHQSSPAAAGLLGS